MCGSTVTRTFGVDERYKGRGWQWNEGDGGGWEWGGWRGGEEKEEREKEKEKEKERGACDKILQPPTYVGEKHFGGGGCCLDPRLPDFWGGG